MPLHVTQVAQRSSAKKIGICPGDEILSMNGESVNDFIDYQYFTAEEDLTVVFRKADGTLMEKTLRRDPYEDFGIDFKESKCRACANNCIFCFIDQLPAGMRDTLYFKDDDWRMSYIMGNYVTLSNVGEREFQRILRRKTPLYISVHATDTEVRGKILNTKNPEILSRLQRLAEAKITFNCQAVLAAGVNDGAVLEKTISDLMPLYPYASSLALVPVGITEHRDGLYPLSLMEKQQARDIIAICEHYQKIALEKYGTRFVFCSDELYFRAELPLPDYEEYEEFEQKEDGVGLVTSFFCEAEEALADCEESSAYKKVTIACGTDVAPIMSSFCKKAAEKLGMEIQVIPIINNHFGRTITISGLMTGGDLIRQLRNIDLGERLFFTQSALREFESVFLDDVTLSELCDILNIKAEPVFNDGYCLINALLGLEVNQ